MIDSYSSTDHQAAAAQMLTFAKGRIDPVQGLNLWGLKYSLKLLLYCVRLRLVKYFNQQVELVSLGVCLWPKLKNSWFKSPSNGAIFVPCFNMNGAITAQMISSQWTGECRQWIMLTHCAYNLGGGEHPAWSPKVAIYCVPTENVWGLGLLTFIPAASHLTADLCRRSAECFKFTIPNENGRKLYFRQPHPKQDK